MRTNEMTTSLELRYARAALLLVAALAGPSGHSASAEWRPDRNVEIVVGTAPGGGVDKTARLIQRILQEKRIADTPVTVVNKPGGGGSIGWTYLNQHPGDGHFIAVTPLNLLTNHITGTSQISPDEITPLPLLGAEYIVFTVKADSPIKTGSDLMARLRKDPQSVNIATATRGGANHIAIAFAAKRAGVDVTRLKIVVFKSGGESATALLGGHVDLVPAAASVVAPQIRDGKLRALAVSSGQRLHGLFAGVPTWKEQGKEFLGERVHEEPGVEKVFRRPVRRTESDLDRVGNGQMSDFTGEFGADDAGQARRPLPLGFMRPEQ
ncbi:MAG: tripartite tricarboxylate transporter substrate binding protein [Betaproteobacteria bacterium]|nr:tripartite tricarboxylate transporter substrate binding protein [Betaproteobacteria bacterium]